MAYPYPIDPLASPVFLPATTDRMGSKQDVFSSGGALYTFLTEAPSLATKQHPLHAYKSVDSGVTWSLVDDLNAPVIMARDDLGEPSSIFAKVKQGTPTTILIPFVKWLNLGLGQPGGELNFVEFDMATDTWGVPVVGGPLVIGTDVSDWPVCLVVGQFCPSTGDYVFVYQARRDPQLPPPRSYRPVFTDMVVYAGGWGAPTVFAGVSGVTTHNCLIRDILIDPATNKLHIFWVTQDWGTTAIQFQQLYHQLYDPGTATLGTPELIPTGTGVYGEPDAGLGVYSGATGGPVMGRAILTSGNYIAIPFWGDRAVPNEAFEPWPQSMVLAALADSPVWTNYPVTAVPAEQVTSGPLSLAGWQVMDAGAGVIRGYWSNPTNLVIQTADFNIGALTWGAVSTVYTHGTNNFGGDLSATAGVASVANVLATDKDTSGNNYSLSFWQFGPISPFDLIGNATIPSGAGVFGPGAVIIGSGAAAAPVPPGGWPVWPPIFRIPNYYDRCLEAFKCHIQRNPMQDASRCVEMVELWSGADIPKGCLEFWKPFKLTTPGPGPDTLVGEFRVPTGYSGMLYGLHLGYTGTGFVEGSGDILWRVTIGNAWAAKGLGNVSTRLGQPNQCLQLTDYIKLKSNQLVQVWVNVPNISGNIQVGASRILATLQGWYYPQ